MSDSQVPSEESDTPKTDAAVFDAWHDKGGIRISCVSADFASAQERTINEALRIIKDYYWVESRSQGREVDQRAGRFLTKMGAL